MVLPLGGCPSRIEYYRLRLEGQKAMAEGLYSPARYFFERGNELLPRQVDNLHDLGTCGVLLAREHFKDQNHAAAMREVDSAIAYYTEALDAHPGHQAALEGKNIALELKGQFDQALEHAEWAAEFVGPQARQYLFLAREREQRGDVDGALLAYRQAVAVEPDNGEAHVAFAKFLIRHRMEEGATYHLQAAYRINPRDEWVMDELARRSALPTLRQEGTRRP